MAEDNEKMEGSAEGEGCFGKKILISDEAFSLESKYYLRLQCKLKPQHNAIHRWPIDPVIMHATHRDIGEFIHTRSSDLILQVRVNNFIKTFIKDFQSQGLEERLSINIYQSSYVFFLAQALGLTKYQVILVGHDFGGSCVSYAMELFPDKVAKAIFIAAAMLKNGQSTLEMFSQQASSDDLMRQAQVFLYANGNDRPPTAIDLDKSLLKDLLFNQSPAKDVALASVSMRPIPFAPVLEKLSLSDLKYGSVKRFYIGTSEDNAIPTTVQESMINESPPEQVLRLKGAHHSPFFSKPQALHKLLVEISKIST